MIDNYGIAPNMTSPNKKMTLSDARDELERQGFAVYEQDFPSLVGIHSSCRLGIMSKIDVMIFVHHVSSDLTLQRLDGDLKDLPSLVDAYSPGGCPQHGASRARIVIVVYLTDKNIDPDAMERILMVPKKEWCGVTFLAAQDGTGNSYFMERTAPIWGRAFYPELHYWAGRMTGRPLPENMPETMKYLKVFNIFLIVYCLIIGFYDPMVYIYFLVMMVAQFGFVALYHCIQKKRYTGERALGSRLLPLNRTNEEHIC